MLAKEGKRVLLLVRGNPSWHVSKRVRAWIKTHNAQVKKERAGVRIVVCPLPIKSPWLNPIEAQWVPGKRAVFEPERLLTAQDIKERVHVYYGCPQEEPLQQVIQPKSQGKD